MSNGVIKDMWSRRHTDNCFFVLCDLDNPRTMEMAKICIQRSNPDDPDSVCVGYLLDASRVSGAESMTPDKDTGAFRCVFSPRVSGLMTTIDAFRSRKLRPFLIVRMPDEWIWKWAYDVNARGESAPRDVIEDFHLRPASVPVLGLSGNVTMEVSVPTM
jgi:hypothetical protein